MPGRLADLYRSFEGIFYICLQGISLSQRGCGISILLELLFLPGFIFLYPEDESSSFIRNVANGVPNYTASHLDIQ
jgi:hypothetical protein